MLYMKKFRQIERKEGNIIVRISAKEIEKNKVLTEKEILYIENRLEGLIKSLTLPILEITAKYKGYDENTKTFKINIVQGNTIKGRFLFKNGDHSKKLEIVKEEKGNLIDIIVDFGAYDVFPEVKHDVQEEFQRVYVLKDE